MSKYLNAQINKVAEKGFLLNFLYFKLTVQCFLLTFDIVIVLTYGETTNKNNIKYRLNIDKILKLTALGL